MIKTFNIKPNMLNMTDKKVGNSVEHIGTGYHFLNRIDHAVPGEGAAAEHSTSFGK